MNNTIENRVEELTKLVLNDLDQMKALDVKVLDVRGKTSITDLMIIATGTSTRHVKAMANSVVIASRAAGHPPLGTEGEGSMEWMLVDLNDVIVHVMLSETREFYNLEKLWEVPASAEESTDTVAGV